MHTLKKQDSDKVSLLKCPGAELRNSMRRHRTIPNRNTREHRRRPAGRWNMQFEIWATPKGLLNSRITLAVGEARKHIFEMLPIGYKAAFWFRSRWKRVNIGKKRYKPRKQRKVNRTTTSANNLVSNTGTHEDRTYWLEIAARGTSSLQSTSFSIFRWKSSPLEHGSFAHEK